jgi:hypothetical protein
MEIIQLTIEHNNLAKEAAKISKDGAELANKARYGNSLKRFSLN